MYVHRVSYDCMADATFQKRKNKKKLIAIKYVKLWQPVIKKSKQIIMYCMHIYKRMTMAILHNFYVLRYVHLYLGLCASNIAWSNVYIIFK